MSRYCRLAESAGSACLWGNQPAMHSMAGPHISGVHAQAKGIMSRLAAGRGQKGALPTAALTGHPLVVQSPAHICPAWEPVKQHRQYLISPPMPGNKQCTAYSPRLRCTYAAHHCAEPCHEGVQALDSRRPFAKTYATYTTILACFLFAFTGQ